MRKLNAQESLNNRPQNDCVNPRDVLRHLTLNMDLVAKSDERMFLLVAVDINFFNILCAIDADGEDFEQDDPPDDDDPLEDDDVDEDDDYGCGEAEIYEYDGRLR